MTQLGGGYQWPGPMAKLRLRLTIDISYYRFMLSCQTSKSIHVHSKVFQWTGGKASAKLMCGWGWDFSHLLDLLPSSLCSVDCIDSFPDSTFSFLTLSFFYFFLLFFIFLSMLMCVSFYLAGIRSWDTNLIDCNLDQELKLFVSRHSARFSADVRGKTGNKRHFCWWCLTMTVWLMPNTSIIISV